ncbi:MAG: ADOP family duplicated permease [Dokdonella sp.]
MTLLQDLRFAVRSLRSHVGTAAFATLTLACGLAAAIAIYCVIDAVLLRALPYSQADRIVQIREVASDGHTMAMALPNYQDLVATIDRFDARTFYNSGDGIVGGAAQTVRAGVAYAGGDFFRAFNAVPQQGRLFGADEHARVAVIGHALWQGLLQGRVDVLGSALDVDGQHYTIVGVMPAGFAFPNETAVWVPLILDEAATSRSAHNFEALGRLRSRDDLAEARLAANALAGRLLQQYSGDIDARAFALTPLAEAIAAPVRSALLLLAAGTAFLLLIAITNATNLMLALHGSRSRELAVRAALGASGLRLARQLLLECLLITSLAAAIGMLLAALAVHLMLRVGGTHLPRLDEIHVSANDAALSLLAAVLIALAMSAAVLWNSQRRSSLAELRESGRGQSPGRSQLRTRAVLLVGQTTLTTLLLIGAALLGRSFLALLAIDPGFASDNAVDVQLSQPWQRDATVNARTAQRYRELMAAFAELPGVTLVGGVNALPLTQDGADGAFWDASVNDFSRPPPPSLGYAEFRVATADYFKAAGIPLRSGRSFDSRDRADGEHVAIVSEVTARATWGTRDPLGQRIQVGNMDGDLRPVTIIGVVADVHERSLEQVPKGAVYVDLDQRPAAAAQFDVIVRSSLTPSTLIDMLRGVLAQHATGIPYSLRALTEVRASALAQRRFSLVLFGAFALVAFVLAIGGLYGLMAFAVGQRTHEFALRQALGSSRGDIARLVLGSGLRIGVFGIALGVAAALAGAHAMQNLLYGVAATDVPVLAGVSALLLSTLVCACLLPAWRACAVAPREALA